MPGPNIFLASWTTLWQQMTCCHLVTGSGQPRCWLATTNPELTHCGLVTPYGDINLGQHWLRQWLVAWWHQAITWTNIDLSSVRSSGIHLRANLEEIPQPSVTEISLKITYLNFFFRWGRTNGINLREVKIKKIRDLFRDFVHWWPLFTEEVNVSLGSKGPLKIHC